MPPHVTRERWASVESYLDQGYSHADIERLTGVQRKTIRRHYPNTAWSQEQRLENLRLLKELRRITGESSLDWVS